MQNCTDKSQLLLLLFTYKQIFLNFVRFDCFLDTPLSLTACNHKKILCSIYIKNLSFYTFVEVEKFKFYAKSWYFSYILNVIQR